MAKKEEKSTLSPKEIKELQQQNEIFTDVLGKLATQNNDDINRKKELDIIAKSIDDVIRTEIDDIKKFTGDDITSFLYKTLSQDERLSNAMMRNIDDIFNSSKNESIASIMFDKNASKNVLLEDLEIISSYIYQLKEAVNATRDAIVTSDDVGQQISRNLTFKNMPQDSEQVTNALKQIENMEDELRLHHKIKNHIVPKTLSFGTYYVYTVPYSKLIVDYKEREARNGSYATSLKESTQPFDTVDIAPYKSIMETTEANIKKSMNVFLEDISVDNTPTSIIPDLVSSEEIHVMESGFYTSDADFNKRVDSILGKKKNTQVRSSESVIDSNEMKAYGGVTGCHVKLIDPRRLVEVKILDKVIGYYYLVDTGIKASKMSFTSTVKFNLNSVAPGQTQDVETSFIQMIAERIVKSMDKKYLEENPKFKELIVNALMYDDLYKRKVKFQFIPVDYITAYSIDEDVNGEGQSMLTNSLFYAKLYLYLLIFKVLSILTKSNDQKFHYVKSSGIDKNTANNTQVVARALKENQINFTDLMNYGSAINKIGKSKDVFVPTGTQNERGIETDILSGQEVQLNTDLMEMLISNAINSTGVPSVIMSYINEADYSRTLVMANAKFIGRVVNYQIDFNRANTELYKKLMRYYLNLDENLVENFEYTFASPKSLNNVNLSDLMSNAEQTANFVVKALVGENRNPSEEDNALKDILFKKVSRELLPMIQWSKMDELYMKSKEDLKKLMAERKAAPPADEV